MATEQYPSGTVPLSSSSRGWVQRISSIFRSETAIQIDHLPLVCVFQVPRTISIQKPEAYAPQLIAMGPYHHLRPELYQMERYKLAAIKEISTPEHIFDFQNLVINRLKEIDPQIRACYNKFMDYDQDALAWILAIDGCFFLHIANSYLVPAVDSDHQSSTSSTTSNDRRLLANTIITRDLLMLENQIPFHILKEIRKALHYFPSANDGYEEDVELISMLLQFCVTQSPIKFCGDKMDSNRFHRPLHLLDLMYHMIVNAPGFMSGALNDPIPRKPLFSEFKSGSSSSSSSQSSSSSGSTSTNDKDKDPELVHNNLDAILDVVESLGTKRTQEILRPVKVVSSIPWSSISGMFRKGNLKNGEENSESDDEIRIPSVSHLWRYAKVQCRPFRGSINEIRFVEEEAALYLPVLSLNASSEVIFRNLVAYEAAMSKSTLEFARYINLMNGIVDAAEDVKLLKQNGVILGSLKDEEIAEMFNGMTRCYVRSHQKTNINVAIEEVNKYYDKKLVVRMVRRMKRNLYTSWKCLALFSTVALLVLMSLQTLCEFYECRSVWKQ